MPFSKSMETVNSPTTTDCFRAVPVEFQPNRNVFAVASTRPAKRIVGTPLPSKATPPSGLISSAAVASRTDSSLSPTRNAKLAFRVRAVMSPRSVL